MSKKQTGKSFISRVQDSAHTGLIPEATHQDGVNKRTNNPREADSDANRPWESLGPATPPPPREGEKGSGG